MKNLFCYVGAFVLLVSSSMSFSKDNYAVVDFEQVLKDAPYAKSLNDGIENKFKPRQKKLLSLREDLQKQSEKIKKDQPVMKESELKKAQAESEKKQKEFEQKSAAFYQELQAAQAKASEDFTDMVQKSMKKYAKKKGISLVFQKPAVAYFDEQTIKEITKDFISSLPSKPKD